MEDAPKRVWMDPTSEDEHGMFIVEGEKRCGNMDVEYVRADIAGELAEALACLLDTSAEGGDDLSEVTRHVFEVDRKARLALANYRRGT